MSSEIAIQGGALTVTTDQTGWTEQQLAVLQSAGVSDQVAPAELDQFLHECQRTGLDPFSRQIYLIGRFDKQAGRDVFRSQTGIDGYRVVAHRAAKRDHVTVSYSDTLWCGPDRVWCDVWLEEWPPRAAKVTVFRGGEPFPAVATLSEYAATYKNGDPTPMWRKMPATMLAKCAEAKALRMAFPHDLAGIYTAEEMEQADNGRREGPAQRHRGPVQDEWNTVAGEVIREQQDADAEAPQDRPLPPPSPLVPTVTPEQLAELARLLKEKRGATNGDRNCIIEQLVRRAVPDVQKLSQAEARSIIETLTAEDDFAAAAAAVGTPANPKHTASQMKMIQASLAEKGITDPQAKRDLIGRILGVPVPAVRDLSKADAAKVIEAFRTGEVPAEQLPGPNANGEGISEFDALDQMIWDVNSQQAHDELQQAITVEVGRGSISASDAGILRERLAAHVARAKAGASA